MINGGVQKGAREDVGKGGRGRQMVMGKIVLTW